MKADEIRELGADDIRARIAELEEERFRLRFRGSTETLDNPLRLRSITRMRASSSSKSKGLTR